MKLATLRNGSRDGQLVVVSRDLTRALPVQRIAATLQEALDNWSRCSPLLQEAAQTLEQGSVAATTFLAERTLAPLPRAYQWVDGSAYVNHVELVRKARGAEMPASFWTDPLVYQGGSDDFLGAAEDAAVLSEDFGIDLEGEVAVITDDVPMGTTPHQARDHIKLLMLVNDWSLRNLIPAELGKGFGFYQSKPSTAFSPVAVTPDELGEAWDGRRLHGTLRGWINGELLGEPDAGKDMQFDFPRLVAHAAKTRPLAAGTIIGTGTVSNRDRKKGAGCLLERRAEEILKSGKAETPFLKFGDRVRIEMRDAGGQSIFGAIDQVVAKSG